MSHRAAAGARGLRWAAALAASVLLVALLAPSLAPYSPNEQALERRLETPSRAHWLGLDELGRDVLSRLILGTRVSVGVGLAVVLLAGWIGTVVGLVAGYAGGRLDAALMRLTDVFMAFPGILLAIALVAVLGPALRNVVVALVVIGWVGYARLVRGQVLQLRETEFVLAARASGVSPAGVALRHLLPNVLPTLVVQASLGMAGAILSEASLSFLGLGIQPPTPSWGAMINAGRSHLIDAPHLALFPGLAILLTVMGLNFLGDALVARLDPQTRGAGGS
ncbi:MAG: ABC transporter permease [Acidobacteriota bacterium]|nr:ABC transporter permease [Acidobacteriota bacterium]